MARHTPTADGVQALTSVFNLRRGSRDTAPAIHSRQCANGVPDTKVRPLTTANMGRAKGRVSLVFKANSNNRVRVQGAEPILLEAMNGRARLGSARSLTCPQHLAPGACHVATATNGVYGLTCVFKAARTPDDLADGVCPWRRYGSRVQGGCPAKHGPRCLFNVSAFQRQWPTRPCRTPLHRHADGTRTRTPHRPRSTSGPPGNPPTASRASASPPWSHG